MGQAGTDPSARIKGNMDSETFDRILDARLESTRKVLASKRKEYAAAGDRLHNFNRAARMLGGSREKALVGMMAKHWVSVLDMVDNIGTVNSPSYEMIEEKIGDSINYLILLEAMLKEDVRKEVEDKEL